MPAALPAPAPERPLLSKPSATCFKQRLTRFMPICTYHGHPTAGTKMGNIMKTATTADVGPPVYLERLYKEAAVSFATSVS